MKQTVTLTRPFNFRGTQLGPGTLELSPEQLHAAREAGIVSEDAAPEVEASAPNPATLSTEKLLGILKQRKVTIYLLKGVETEVPAAGIAAGITQAAETQTAPAGGADGQQVPAVAATTPAAAADDKDPMKRFAKWAAKLAENSITTIEELKAADVDKLEHLSKEAKGEIKAELALLEE